MKSRKASIVAATLGLSFAWIALARDNELNRRSLRGLIGVTVSVQKLTEHAKPSGITEQSIQTAVELRLRTLGIRVLAHDEWESIPGGPALLNIHVTVLQSGELPSFACQIDLELLQMVVLARNQELSLAETWSTGQLLTGTSDLVRQQVQHESLLLVDQFANVYAVAGSDPPGPGRPTDNDVILQQVEKLESMLAGPRTVLRGISALQVDIVPLGANAKAIGLREEVLKTAAELRLRTLGITVLPKEATNLHNGFATLHVSCSVALASSDSPPKAACNIALDLLQLIHLYRDSSFVTATSTWSMSRVEIGEYSPLRQNVEDRVVRQLVDSFVNDYLAENPRVPTTQPTAPSASLRYDGVYRSGPKDAGTTPSWNYLRFYPGGEVINVSSTGQPEYLREWFAKEHPAASRGKVTIEGNRISFTALSAQGAVDHTGEVKGDRIFLESYSHINQHQGSNVYLFLKW